MNEILLFCFFVGVITMCNVIRYYMAKSGDENQKEKLDKTEE